MTTRTLRRDRANSAFATLLCHSNCNKIHDRNKCTVQLLTLKCDVSAHLFGATRRIRSTHEKLSRMRPAEFANAPVEYGYTRNIPCAILYTRLFIIFKGFGSLTIFRTSSITLSNLNHCTRCMQIVKRKIYAAGEECDTERERIYLYAICSQIFVRLTLRKKAVGQTKLDLDE